jgi:hypothetical protein
LAVLQQLAYRDELVLLALGLLAGDFLFFLHRGYAVERAFLRFANRRATAALSCAALSMGLRLLLLPLAPIPDPTIPDEFSYLLGAQTFLAGRLTNPVPPAWHHFESFHINVVPTYQTMYPPAPSLFMAAGMLFGSPWWGVWLSTGLLCAAVCWALQPFIGNRYALLAGGYCALKYTLGTNLGDSYWGGSFAALGSAILLGAYGRIAKTPRLRYVFLFVLGLALLANTRPFEGFFFALPVGVMFLIDVVRRREYVRVLLPAVAMLALLALAMAYYNRTGTGNALEMPYMANFRQYHFVRPFVGGGIGPIPYYSSWVLHDFFVGRDLPPGELARTWKGLRFLTINKHKAYYAEHYAPLFTLALIGLVVAMRSRRRAALFWTALSSCIALYSVVWWALSSYAGPLLVSYFGLAFLGLRYLRTVRLKGKRVGMYWARGVVGVLLIFCVLSLRARTLDAMYTRRQYPLASLDERARLVRTLENTHRRYLLLVRYAPWHDLKREWVYNGPNISQQPVIFARSLGARSDCELMARFPDRTILYVEPDGQPWPRLVDPATSPMAAECQEFETGG